MVSKWASKQRLEFRMLRRTDLLVDLSTACWWITDCSPYLIWSDSPGKLLPINASIHQLTTSRLKSFLSSQRFLTRPTWRVKETCKEVLTAITTLIIGRNFLNSSISIFLMTILIAANISSIISSTKLMIFWYLIAVSRGKNSACYWQTVSLDQH